MFQQMTYIDAYINFISVTCSPRNAKTTIGQYRLSSDYCHISTFGSWNIFISVL